MKTASPELLAHFRQSTTTLATLLEIARLDGVILYFTDLDQGFLYNGNFYKPYTGYAPSALETNTNASVDNQSIIGILDGTTISLADIRAGLYDFANAKLSIVNYKDLSMGEMAMLSGKFGEAILDGNQFTIELRGMAQLLQQKMGELYLPSCPAVFGDARCKINAEDLAYTKSFTVSAIIVDAERRKFRADILLDPTEYFDNGLVTFDEVSANPGAQMDVKLYTLLDAPVTGQVELYEPLANNIQVGDEGIIVVGCPKSKQACKTKFLTSNIINFRGFPHLIGATTALKGIS